MEIHGQYPVGTGYGDQIGNQLGGNRGPWAGLAILTGIAVIGDNSRYPAGRTAPQGIERDQQFHQVVIGRERGRLQDENILATHILQNFNEHLHIGKPADAGFGQRGVESGGNRFREGAVAVTGEQFHGMSGVVGWPVECWQ